MLFTGSQMKSARTCIGIAVILVSCFSGQATSQPQQTDKNSTERISPDSKRSPRFALTSLVAWTIAPPQPVLATDGKVHLVYELLVMDVSSSTITLARPETLHASENQ